MQCLGGVCDDDVADAAGADGGGGLLQQRGRCRGRAVEGDENGRRGVDETILTLGRTKRAEQRARW